MRFLTTDVVGCITVAALAVATYRTLFVGEWEFISTWDDDGNFLENDLFRGLDWPHVRAMWSAVLINVYEPVAWMFKAAVFSVAGLSSRAVRVATLGAHAAASALIFLLLRRLSAVWSRARRVERGGATAGALLGAAIFAVHPLNVEVVCWPSAQPYAVGMVFAAACLLAYAAARWPSGDGDAPLSLPLLACSVLCYALAVLCKSVYVTLPAALVCVEFAAAMLARSSAAPHPLRRSLSLRVELRALSARLLPFGAFAAATLWMTLAANRDGARFDSDTISLTPGERAVKASMALVACAGRVVWPALLRPHYVVRERNVQAFGAERCGEIVVLPGDAASGVGDGCR